MFYFNWAIISPALTCIFLLQFDPNFVPQASLPAQPSPVFGGITTPSFQPSMPPPTALYDLGSGASLYAAAFPGDFNSTLNISDRPKKVGVSAADTTFDPHSSICFSFPFLLHMQ